MTLVEGVKGPSGVREQYTAFSHSSRCDRTLSTQNGNNFVQKHAIWNTLYVSTKENVTIMLVFNVLPDFFLHTVIEHLPVYAALCSKKKTKITSLIPCQVRQENKEYSKRLFSL